MVEIAEFFRLHGLWAYGLLAATLAGLVAPVGVASVDRLTDIRLPSAAWLAAPCAVFAVGALAAGLGHSEVFRVVDESPSNLHRLEILARGTSLELQLLMVGAFAAFLSALVTSVGFGLTRLLGADEGARTDATRALIPVGMSLVGAGGLAAYNILVHRMSLWAYLPVLALLVGGVGVGLTALHEPNTSDEPEDTVVDRHVATIVATIAVATAAITDASSVLSSIFEAIDTGLEVSYQMFNYSLTIGALAVGLMLIAGLSTSFRSEFSPVPSFDSQGALLVAAISLPAVAAGTYPVVQINSALSRLDRASKLSHGDVRIDVSRSKLDVDGEKLLELRDGRFWEEDLGSAGSGGRTIVEPLRQKTGPRMEAIRRERALMGKDSPPEVAVGTIPAVPDATLELIARTLANEPAQTSSGNKDSKFVKINEKNPKKPDRAREFLPFELKLALWRGPFDSLPENGEVVGSFDIVHTPKATQGDESPESGSDSPSRAPDSDTADSNTDTDDEADSTIQSEFSDRDSTGITAGDDTTAPEATWSIEVRPNGFALSRGEKAIQPLEGCEASGPTVCLRTARPDSAIEAAAEAYGAGDVSKGRKHLEQLAASYDFRRLYNTLATSISDEGEKSLRKKSVRIGLADELPIYLLAETRRHVETRLDKRTYADRDAYLSARQASQSSRSERLFDTIRYLADYP